MITREQFAPWVGTQETEFVGVDRLDLRQVCREGVFAQQIQPSKVPRTWRSSRSICLRRVLVGDSPTAIRDSRYCGQDLRQRHGWRRQRPRSNGYRISAAPKGNVFKVNPVQSRLAGFAHQRAIMYVYFLRVSKPNRMKIGKSRDPIARMHALQTGCPSSIHLAGVIQCRDDKQAYRVERAFHEYFSDKRKVGEWFHCADAVLCKVWEVLNILSERETDVKAFSAVELAALYANR